MTTPCQTENHLSSYQKILTSFPSNSSGTRSSWTTQFSRAKAQKTSIASPQWKRINIDRPDGYSRSSTLISYKWKQRLATDSERNKSRPESSLLENKKNQYCSITSCYIHMFSFTSHTLGSCPFTWNISTALSFLLFFLSFLHNYIVWTCWTSYSYLLTSAY